MRIASIDILRAATMLLMVWVNDFWTLSEVPKWLQHATYDEDYLGFSDIIFPLFLFIVGLSIPFAIQNRLNRNESRYSIIKHVFIRSASLLFIGVFMVNYETAHHESIVIGKYGWGLIMAFAVILVWMNWKKSPVPIKWNPFLQAFGIILFIYLAIIYKGGTEGGDWMKTQWWGILGLIGWAYFINALIYIFSKGNLAILILACITFFGLSVLNQSGNPLDLEGLFGYFSVIYKGTLPAFTTGGIIASLLFKKFFKIKLNWAYLVLIILGLINLGFGLFTRPEWGISKLRETPSWLAICTGIGLILFALLYYVSDEKKHVNWARVIYPAGTATFTCYLIPYFIYPIRELIGFSLPKSLTTSITGLFSSFVFALLVVVFTGWLEKKRFTLKL